jgi:hypothetical protein
MKLSQIPVFLWSLPCLISAVIFFLFRQPAAAKGLPSFILSYDHALIWLLLAVSFMVRSYSKALADIFALLGLM